MSAAVPAILATMPRTEDSANVSPTAHYTGYVWARNGLSHPAFATIRGRLFHTVLRPPLALSKALGGPTLEGLLLARHRVLDQRLRDAIDTGRVTQIIELAAGLSPRGWRFAAEYGRRIHYIETDLPGMAARKASVLDRAQGGSPRHRVIDCDAFALEGPHSLAAIAATLDPEQGLAIITEGLVNYFSTEDLRGLWARIAATLSGFRHGLYLSDIHLGADNRGAATRRFAKLLSLFVRGSVHLHFRDSDDARQALLAAGFHTAELLRPADFAAQFGECGDPAAKLVRIVEATTGH